MASGAGGQPLDRVLVVKLFTRPGCPIWRRCSTGCRSRAHHGVVLRLSRAVQSQRDALHGLADGATLSQPRPASQPGHLPRERPAFRGRRAAARRPGFFLNQRDNRARVETLAASQGDAQPLCLQRRLFALHGTQRHQALLSLDSSTPPWPRPGAISTSTAACRRWAAARHRLLVEGAVCGAGWSGPSRAALRLGGGGPRRPLPSSRWRIPAC